MLDSITLFQSDKYNNYCLIITRHIRIVNNRISMTIYNRTYCRLDVLVINIYNCTRSDNIPISQHSACQSKNTSRILTDTSRYK